MGGLRSVEASRWEASGRPSRRSHRPL